MKAKEFITEGLNHPTIVVDVQPAYCENNICPDIIKFVAKQNGPVLMFVNAEDQELTEDTVNDIVQYWNDTVCDPEEQYVYDDELDDYVEQECDTAINWKRFQIVDKGYGYFRAYMDQSVPDATMIKMIRYLYQNKLNDARDLDYEDYVNIMGNDRLIDEVFSVNWTSVAQLKRFSGAYLVGGGRNECLREIELLMNAFNIKYKRIDTLVYG